MIKEKNENSPNKDIKYEINLSFELTEKMQKIYRRHRDTNIIDRQFVEEVMYECIGVEIETAKI